ncbi:hypothetical protein AVV02_gp238 [Bacillus phage AvesoBmore]|uniref:Uncharacterized protein n=2 Tax=Bequatrovirus TaxID=1917990 RepID=A0A0K2D1C3_9CAUD|nr:hypothetical protein AVV02_gp238 [Bacillus phage AvesoBmore]ALA13416.1 hypothetical protein AVESOBMORE_238 [Bacillus phage AvesoBmore]
MEKLYARIARRRKKTMSKPKACSEVKECILCFNTNKDEIEKVPVFTDRDGNEGEFVEWMCKEGEGCC